MLSISLPCINAFSASSSSSPFQVFKEESQPVIDALKGTGRVAEIDAQGDPADVFVAVAEFMTKLVAPNGERSLNSGTSWGRGAMWVGYCGYHMGRRVGVWPQGLLVPSRE